MSKPANDTKDPLQLYLRATNTTLELGLSDERISQLGPPVRGRLSVLEKIQRYEVEGIEMAVNLDADRLARER